MDQNFPFPFTYGGDNFFYNFGFLEFPLEHLPPFSRTVLEAVIQSTQVDVGMAFSVLLGSISLAAQGTFIVRRTESLTSPLGVFIIVCAKSGSGKTHVKTKLFKPHEAFQALADAQFLKEEAEHKKASKISNIKQKSLEMKLKSAFDNEDPTEDIELQLAIHAQNEPVRPRKLKLIYSDTTPEAFVWGLYENSSSAGIIEDEAGGFLTRTIGSDIAKALFNKGWEKGRIIVDRKSSKSFVVCDPYVTLMLLIQEELFQKFLESGHGAARDIGLCSRCLICTPKKRLPRTSYVAPGTDEHLQKYYDRITDLLKNAPTGENHRIELIFHPGAQKKWAQVYDQFEAQTSPGGLLANHSDWGAKAPENIARVAALLHVFEGYEGTEISLETLQSAIKIVLWFAQEFVLTFPVANPQQGQVKDAITLDEWIIESLKSGRLMTNLPIALSMFRQFGPNALRQGDRLIRALEKLAEANRLSISSIISPGGSIRGMQIILNDYYYGNLIRGQDPWGDFMLLPTEPPYDDLLKGTGQL